MNNCYICGKPATMKADAKRYVCNDCANSYIKKNYKKIRKEYSMKDGAPYGDDADHGEAVVGYAFVAIVTFVIGFLACLVVCGGK